MVVQANELLGTPSYSSSRFDLNTGIFAPAGNIVDPSAKIGRTREAIVGASHELLPNLAIGVDYIYRKYDRGTANYVIGFEPGAAGYPLSQIYADPIAYTDPVSGLTGHYHTVRRTGPCPVASLRPATGEGCRRPSGVGNITLTDPNYQIYHGVDITATKRYSDRWQMQVALTLQRMPDYYPEGSPSFNNPTNREFIHGFTSANLGDREWIFKASGSYTFPMEITASANFNYNQGDVRIITINGPGRVFGGVGQSTINYGSGSLRIEPAGATRLEPHPLLDLGLQKTFMFRGGRNRVKLMFEAFNVFNVNTVTDWVSDNRSNIGFLQPEDIVPPRVFRFGTQIGF
jgi:hypothetical protein